MYKSTTPSVYLALALQTTYYSNRLIPTPRPSSLYIRGTKQVV
jgi:hypothetical protein